MAAFYRDGRRLSKAVLPDIRGNLAEHPHRKSGGWPSATGQSETNETEVKPAKQRGPGREILGKRDWLSLPLVDGGNPAGAEIKRRTP